MKYGDIKKMYDNFISKYGEVYTYAMYRKHKVKGLKDEQIYFKYIEYKPKKYKYERYKKLYERMNGDFYSYESYKLLPLHMTDEEIIFKWKKWRRQIYLTNLWKGYINVYGYGFCRNTYIEYLCKGYTDEQINKEYIKLGNKPREIFFKEDYEYLNDC